MKPKDPNAITKMSFQIHLVRARLWTLNKALLGVRPYCLSYKTMDIPTEIKKSTNKLLTLKDKREKLKASIPKENWYPRRKYSGRYNNTENEVKTMIMRECIDGGFNVKSVAGYFGLALPSVYQRVKLKMMRVKKMEKTLSLQGS